jgi:hypothetical protein
MTKNKNGLYGTLKLWLLRIIPFWVRKHVSLEPFCDITRHTHGLFYKIPLLMNIIMLMRPSIIKFPR